MPIYNYVKPLWQNGPIAVHNAPAEVARRIEAAVEHGPRAADEEASVERLVRLVDDHESGLFIALVQCEISLQVDAIDFTYRRARFLHAIAMTRDALDGAPLTRELAIEIFRRRYGARITEGISGQQSLIEQLEYPAGIGAAQNLFIEDLALWRAAMGEPEPTTLAHAAASTNHAAGDLSEVPTSLNTLLKFKSPNPVEGSEWPEPEPEFDDRAPGIEARPEIANTALSASSGASSGAIWETAIDLPATALAKAMPEPLESLEVDDVGVAEDDIAREPTNEAPVEPVASLIEPLVDPALIGLATEPTAESKSARNRWPHLFLAAAAIAMIGISVGFFAGKLGPSAQAHTPAVSSAPQLGPAALAARFTAYEERIAQYEETMRRLEQRIAAREQRDADAPPASPAPGDVLQPASAGLTDAPQLDARHARLNASISPSH